MEADGPQAADAQGGSGLPRLEEAEGLSAGASEGGRGTCPPLDVALPAPRTGRESSLLF